MAKILYITANPKSVKKAFSLSLGDRFLKEYQAAKPSDEIVFIDLYETDIPEIDADLLYVIENLKKGVAPNQLTEEVSNKLQRYNEFTDQFIGADKYIFVTPLWNLGLPSRVKAYIDTVCVAGKTFNYTERGPQGLLENKKCLHIHASGGFHSEDPYNHADPYLKDIMKFIGISDYRTLLVEGHGALPDKAEDFLDKAYVQIPGFVEWFSN